MTLGLSTWDTLGIPSVFDRFDFEQDWRGARISLEKNVNLGTCQLTIRAMTARSATVVGLHCLLVALVAGVLSPTTTAEAATNSLPTLAAFDAPYFGSPPSSNPAVVGIAAGADGTGYYVLRSNGEVDAYGAPSYTPSVAASLPFGTTATGIALDAATGGYWVVFSNGTVKGHNAPFLGQPHIPSGGWGQHPAAVAIASTPDGSGYYVLRANGSVGAYGVPARGSLGGHLPYGVTAPVVGVALAVDPATGGYWIATSTGGVASFDAPNYGSPLASAHGKYDGVPVSALAAATNGTGYDVLKANGVIGQYSAALHGSPTALQSMPAGGFASALALSPASAGYYVAFDVTPHDGYLNPLRALTSLVPQEIDQGVDYCASGPIYALGNAVVVNLYEPGWPSGVFITYQLTNGPAKGRYVFVAENVTPQVVIGEHVTSATVVGVAHDAKTCFETGWADPPSSPHRAAAHAEYNGKNSTAYGLNFSSLLQSLGARPGLPQHLGSPGPLPDGWPRW